MRLQVVSLTSGRITAKCGIVQVSLVISISKKSRFLIIFISGEMTPKLYFVSLIFAVCISGINYFENCLNVAKYKNKVSQKCMYVCILLQMMCCNNVRCN